ncbi:ABC transporter permease [uncultured Aquimarina sp.]|uniref:ABC transporter permease n=1 Tax=uncultured Aquimarina sp. TaxID=575652 RepID=UPI00261B4FCB|nr:ABC transporter permease [uncultured Aquimarina sp.]
MESIKKLFTLKKMKRLTTSFENEEDREQIRITYYQTGYGASKTASGNPITLGVGLHNLYNSFEDQCRKQLQEQQRLKQPYKEEQERHRTDLKKNETAIAIYQEEERKIVSDIEAKQFEMIDVKQNPDNYGIDADKRPKAQFYIGLLLLLPITTYLFVFYISASYSAFFKSFENDSLSAAIFDANAFSKAISDGLLEAIFVGTLPFVFMGLGYLIHMFQNNKSKLSIIKIGALFLLTFVFDVILAYLIERKIFLYDAVLGDKFTPEIAIKSVNFWGIIFAGFVVYIIWGLVFDFVMREHENVDKIRAYIGSVKEELKILLKRKTELLDSINQLKQETTYIKGKIAEVQSKIDGFIFPVKEYLHYHYQYKEGWYQAINTELAMPHKEKDELLNNCEEVSKAHIQEHNLNQMDHQHLVFGKN